MTEPQLIPLSVADLDTVSGGADAITARFKYGDFSMEIYADKDRYIVCTSTSKQSGQSCVKVT